MTVIPEDLDPLPHPTQDSDAPVPMAVACEQCEATVICTPKGWTFFYDPEEGPPERWTLARCPKGHPLLILQNEYSPGMSFNDDTPYRMYPPQDRHLSQEIPKALREAHEEARKCFRAKSWPATVAMCGRTLEGACKLHGIKPDTLDKMLKAMKEQEIIDGRLFEWANTLRGVRNAAAHFDAEGVTKQDAEDSLAYSEALLDYLYVLRARFDAMKARRNPVSTAEGKRDVELGGDVVAG